MGLFWSLYSHILSLSLPPSLPLPPHPTPTPPRTHLRRGGGVCLWVSHPPASSHSLTPLTGGTERAPEKKGKWSLHLTPHVWGFCVSLPTSVGHQRPLFSICVSQILTRKERSHWNWDQEEEKKQILVRSYKFLQHMVHTFWKLKSDKSVIEITIYIK